MPVQTVRMLLDAGADSSHAARCRCRQERGRPQRPYGLEASVWGHVEVVRLLLEADAGKNSADNDGITALIQASGEGSVFLA